jgi:phosphatidylinositol 4-kinase
MRKVRVDVGVYLPSNPDGIVVDIDYNSGRPLQSHAKAPFMATFRIQRIRDSEDDDTDVEEDGNDAADDTMHSATVAKATKTEQALAKARSRVTETWLSAIFKVGDDCRQDVLALQLIAMFRSIFSSVGLDLWVFPYRVVATAPGCGVIDVIPNSISRDQMGREKVNSLYDYYVTKFGGVDSIQFQKARNNFIKSVAAYSVISYLLQFKDRHNGNIMVDNEGHMIHIGEYSSAYAVLCTDQHLHDIQ